MGTDADGLQRACRICTDHAEQPLAAALLILVDMLARHHAVLEDYGRCLEALGRPGRDGGPLPPGPGDVAS